MAETADPALAAQPTPGGGALLRLVNPLEARGYDTLASAAVDVAVPDDARELFASRAERHASSPTRRATRRAAPPARRGRRGAGETSAAPDAENVHNLDA